MANDNIDPIIIKFYAKNAGWKGGDIDTAVAVALAESGGNPKTHNNKPPDDSYGLYQINYFKGIDPNTQKYVDLRTPRTKEFGSPESLYDPQKNTQAAYSIWKVSGWSAWTTYTSGRYKDFLGKTPGAELGKTIPENAKADAKDAANTAANVASDIPSAINAFSSTIFKGMSNIVGVIVAVVFLVLGVVILVMNTKTGSAAVKTATKVAKVAAVA